MEVADLFRLMENPALLNKETLPQLQQMVNSYPYFQVVRMLYLKNLAVLNDIRFNSELRKMVIHISDRKRLFTFIEGERFGLHILPIKENPVEVRDSFALIDAFLSDHEEDKSQIDTTFSFHPSVSSDYINWSLEKEHDPEEGKDIVRLQHQELIDSFIENEEEHKLSRGLCLEKESMDVLPPENLIELEEEHPKSLDDSYFTETLAHIYIKQKRYEKALQIIKNLNLKYPEKNIYFADQIRFLEKLIINTKK